MSFESPFKVLYNNAGAEVAVVSGSQMDHARPGIGLLAKDGEGAGQFLTVNNSGKLLVDADVNVTLDHTDDSVTVHGSEGAALQQSAAHGDALKVIDTDVSGAIVTMKQALSGAIDYVGTMLEATLTSIDDKVATNAKVTEISSSLAQNQYVDGKLRVDADVNVQLTYDDDSVTIHGDEGLAFAQVSGSGEMITMPLGSEGFAFLQAASGSTHHTEDNSALLVGLMGSASRNVLLSSGDDVLFVSATLNDTTISQNLGILAGTQFATDADILALQNAVTAAQDAIVAKLGSDVDIRDLAYTADSVTAHQGGEWHVSQAGDWTVDRTVAQQASVTKQSLANSNVEVIDAGQANHGASFYWSAPQGAVCYIRLGADAAQTDHYTVKLVNGGYYELPARYAGKVQAIAGGGSGDLMVTKF